MLFNVSCDVIGCEQEVRLEEMREVLRKYRRLEELVARSQGRKGQGRLAHMGSQHQLHLLFASAL